LRILLCVCTGEWKRPLYRSPCNNIARQVQGFRIIAHIFFDDHSYLIAVNAIGYAYDRLFFSCRLIASDTAMPAPKPVIHIKQARSASLLPSVQSLRMSLPVNSALAGPTEIKQHKTAARNSFILAPRIRHLLIRATDGASSI
jgi:hypothetical protein